MSNESDKLNMHVFMAKILQDASENLALFLNKILPNLFDDWWNKAVFENLSFHQRRRVKERTINSLTSLDLAALLRVLDQNWYQISHNLNLPSEARHFVKEMQTVRNRWAHAGSEGVPEDDAYRDLDTLQRFLIVIEADGRLLEEIKKIKASLHSNDRLDLLSKDTREAISHKVAPKPDFEFVPGQIVYLKSNPSMKGAVTEAIAGKPENRFLVFMDGETKPYYFSQLMSVDEPRSGFRFLPSDEFHSYLTALQIRYPGLSNLYSWNAARVDFIPHQFRPVLRFIHSDRPRLLIADGVGVGKTIEAGLILRELQARRDIRSILIICPRSLVAERKWEIEMKRFEERFVHLNGPTLRYCLNEMDLDGDWPEQYQRIIVPYSLFDETLLYGSGGKRKQKKGLLDLDPPPRFDLVIVDEAHHIRNRNTFNHKAVRFFCDHAEAVVFLTATPIQTSSDDLFVLLKTLRPDLIIDEESFTHMSEPNPFINEAITKIRAQEKNWIIQAKKSLEKAALTDWGYSILRHNPEFIRINKLLATGKIELEERVQLISDTEKLHTFSGLINRTRRSDIGEFTVRKPKSVLVEFTPSQRELHDGLLQVQANIFSRLHSDVNVNFLMTTIRRRAASCIFGLVPVLEEILNRHFDELLRGEVDNTQFVALNATVNSIELQIHEILKKARNLDPYDPKLEALQIIIQDKQKLLNNKVLLFSTFRHTLHYLYEHLKTDGIRVEMVHGETPDYDRTEIRNRFELAQNQDDSLDVLLMSEIGSEGLDYQFCDCIVNYDLPWNPMIVEQRIGRIDRIGQKSESIGIFNLITPGTVDADIYYRCLMRIGVFESAIGGSEAILGEITKGIRNIAGNFSLSETERRKKFDQLMDNNIRLIQDQGKLEKKQYELFGIRLPEDQFTREIEQASSYWLHSNSINRLITNYLQRTLGKSQKFIFGEKPLKTLRLSQDARNNLLQDFRNLPRQNTTYYREWENWLKGGSPRVPVTFESECASHQTKALFLMPLHPLVKQAANKFETKGRILTGLRAKSDIVPEGSYHFVIYQWRFYGIRDDLVLQPVATTDSVTKHISKLLEESESLPKESVVTPDANIWNELDAQHHKVWSEARIEHQRRTQELAEFRRESLATSHKARITLLGEQLEMVTDKKIQKMRLSQIVAAEDDYARRLQELEIAMERAEITAAPVAYGNIRVEGEL